jgi:hypothetical protein
MPYTYGEFELDDIRTQALSNRWQIWVVVEDGDLQNVGAVAVTGLFPYPRACICEIIAAAATIGRDYWRPLHETVEDWARGQGCSRMKSNSRRGMEKVLKPIGYELCAVVMGKVLNA